MKKKVKSLFRLVLIIFYPVFAFFLPLKKKTILFESYLGKKVNDSPLEIYKYINEHYPEYELIWAVDDQALYEDVTTVKRMSFKYVVIAATSKFFVNNSRMPIFFKKRKSQIYVQTWHGTPLKKLVYDMENNLMPGTTEKKYLKNFSNEVRNWDYLVSANEYSTKIFKRAFKYEKKILEVGYPRNFSLYTYSEKDRNYLRAKYKIEDDQVAILYTPTYRETKNFNAGKYYQELMLDLDKLNEASNIKVLLRLHYLISENIDVSNYQNIINVSDVQDVNELYIVSDVLLNDYSSTMFDYLALNKPIIFFPYDLEEYEKEIRGFYLNYNLLPGEQIKSTERLIEIASNLKGYTAIWEHTLNEYRDKMVLDNERDATSIIVETMLDNE